MVLRTSEDDITAFFFFLKIKLVDYSRYYENTSETIYGRQPK